MQKVLGSVLSTKKVKTGGKNKKEDKVEAQMKEKC
jgi:hypothetical protein